MSVINLFYSKTPENKNKNTSQDKNKKERTTLVGRFFVLCVCVSFVAGVSENAVAADEAVDKRLKRIERLLENQNSMQMFSMLQSLQREVSELRGDVEVLSFELEKIKKQQKDIYIDLDQRIQDTDNAVAKLKLAPPALGAGSLSSTTADAGSSMAEDEGAQETLGEQESYQAALATLKGGRYENAIEAYQVFLITYPESVFASNAQYWMAEAYYVLKEFDSAISQFQKVVAEYPGSRKVADAYLKTGFSYYEKKDWKNARIALERVVTEYSSSTASRLAQRRLQKMKVEGKI